MSVRPSGSPRSRGGGEFHTVVRHRQNGNLRDTSVPAFDPTGSLVDRRQIRVHVTGVTASTGNFLSSGRDFTQRVGVRRHVGQDDENVLLELVRKVLGGREGETRSNDTLDPAQKPNQSSLAGRI